MAQRLQGAPAPVLLTDEDSPTDEKASAVKRKRQSIKSGKLRIRDTHVIHRIKWPHEMVCCAQGKAPVYEMSLSSFANGYLGIVAEEGSPIREWMLSHLRELFNDVDVYRWRVVREYHATWLKLLEQGQAVWKDEGKRAHLRHLIVWSKPSLSSMFSRTPPTPVTSTASHPPNQGWVGRFGYVTQPSKPGDRASSGFNRVMGNNNVSHPSDLHVCSYCLMVAQKLCRHPDSMCNPKAGANNGKGGGV